jgi:hypothetical protein
VLSGASDAASASGFDPGAMLASVGLDPEDASKDLATPVGIGNVAGARVTRVRGRDGMNQLGDERGRQYNKRPYEDYTGYRPVNTADKLGDPSRWQPLSTRQVTVRSRFRVLSRLNGV